METHACVGEGRQQHMVGYEMQRRQDGGEEDGRPHWSRSRARSKRSRTRGSPSGDGRMRGREVEVTYLLGDVGLVEPLEISIR